MPEYQVLARKYRSRTFEEVVGQQPIANMLTNAIASGRIAHAYLFTGTRGVGKTTMARIFAKALNCLSADAPTPHPCNKCDACIAIGRGDDIDVVEIDGASNRGIDEVRELRASAILHPARSRYKIYYIDEVHMLTTPAFNALLKTLEEPPPHVKFLFSTTDPQKLPATILSRCQRYDFRSIPTMLIAEHLSKLCKQEKVDFNPEAIGRIARAGAGSMRDSMSLLDQILAGSQSVSEKDVVSLLGLPSDQRMGALADHIAQGQAAAALGELDEILAGGVNLLSAVAALGETFRCMMISSVCGPDSDLIDLPAEARRAIAELSGKFSLPSLVQMIAVVQNLQRQAGTSVLARAMVEAGLIRLAQADKFIDPASLIERLEAIDAARGGSAGEKKKPQANLTPPAGNYQPASPAVDDPQAGKNGLKTAPAGDQSKIDIQWDRQWLGANWQKVIEALAASGKMHLAGALAPASVVGFEEGKLRLGFDASHESLRRRCQGQLIEDLKLALSQLAGMEIELEIIAESRPSSRPNGLLTDLTTAERNELAKDPAVRSVMGLFGGEIIDIRKDQLPTEATEEEH